jgi:hypothetical protein
MEKIKKTIKKIATVLLIIGVFTLLTIMLSHTIGNSLFKH